MAWFITWDGAVFPLAQEADVICVQRGSFTHQEGHGLGFVPYPDIQGVPQIVDHGNPDLRVLPELTEQSVQEGLLQVGSKGRTVRSSRPWLGRGRPVSGGRARGAFLCIALPRRQCQ